MGHAKPIREFVNQTGTLLVSEHFPFEVCFDLLELQDSAEEVAGKRCTYGRLQYRQQLEPALQKLLLSSSRLALTGGGIEVSIYLHGCNSFGLVGAIKDVAEK